MLSGQFIFTYEDETGNNFAFYSDDGQSWKHQNLSNALSIHSSSFFPSFYQGAPGEIVCVAFQDEVSILLVTHFEVIHLIQHGLFYSSVDSGQTYQLQSSFQMIGPTVGITFFNGLYFLANGTTLEISKDGSSWSLAPNYQSNPFNYGSNSFFASNLVFVFANSLLYSSADGFTWNIINRGLSGTFQDAAYFNDYWIIASQDIYTTKNFQVLKPM